MSDISPRTFLFLQGPHGSYFARLGGALAARGHRVHRINLCGGDRRDWPGEATNYRGTRRNWPTFFDDFIVDHEVTDLILFGDCRPAHASAHGMAMLRGVRVHVVEEGYLRPDFITMEEGGVNGHSPMPRDPNWFRAEAARLPDLSTLPAVPSSFARRVNETVRHLLATALERPLFPFYRNHRPLSSATEGLGWLLRSAMSGFERSRSARAMERIADKRYFLLPLQLNSDYQIRVHSPFGDMRAALRFIIKSFAKAAPEDVHLLVKRHPLDAGLVPWRRITTTLAWKYGVADRVHYISDGDIADVLPPALGAVMVNSTAGTLALNLGKPVAVLGHAVYDIEGVVHQAPLDEFWAEPAAPDPDLWSAVRRVIIDRSLVRGSFLSEEGLAMLVENAVPRLTSPPAPPAQIVRIAHWR
jgi:capsular polysaccharide export protein